MLSPVWKASKERTPEAVLRSRSAILVSISKCGSERQPGPSAGVAIKLVKRRDEDVHAASIHTPGTRDRDRAGW
jgi:hypothetical protein